MSDKDKQPLAASASAPQVAESADAALKHIVDGFLHFHHDVFPQQEELFKKLATAHGNLLWPGGRRAPGCSHPAGVCTQGTPEQQPADRSSTARGAGRRVGRRGFSGRAAPDACLLAGPSDPSLTSS